MAERSFSLTDCFAHVEDPRLERTKLHLLEDILALTICAVICGANTFVAIEQFGRAKHDWLGRFLSLPNGIPSHDTIGDVLARIDPHAFEQGFLDWVRGIAELTEGEVVATRRQAPAAQLRPAFEQGCYQNGLGEREPSRIGAGQDRR